MMFVLETAPQADACVTTSSFPIVARPRPTGDTEALERPLRRSGDGKSLSGPAGHIFSHRSSRVGNIQVVMGFPRMRLQSGRLTVLGLFPLLLIVNGGTCFCHGLGGHGHESHAGGPAHEGDATPHVGSHSGGAHGHHGGGSARRADEEREGPEPEGQHPPREHDCSCQGPWGIHETAGLQGWTHAGFSLATPWFTARTTSRAEASFPRSRGPPRTAHGTPVFLLHCRFRC